MSNRSLTMIGQDGRSAVHANVPDIPFVASVNGHAQAVVVVVGVRRDIVIPHVWARDRALGKECNAVSQWAA